MCYIDYYYCYYLLVCLIISLFFIHKDWFEPTVFLIFDQYAFNVITEKCYVFMYLCAEIIYCLVFTVLLHYTSINHFSRIDKIKTVKVFEKI